MFIRWLRCSTLLNDTTLTRKRIRRSLLFLSLSLDLLLAAQAVHAQEIKWGYNPQQTPDTKPDRRQNYPEGQRGTIYSDDINAVRNDQRMTIGGPANDPSSRSYNNGKHVSPESGVLHPRAEAKLLNDQAWALRRRLDVENADNEYERRQINEMDKQIEDKQSDYDTKKSTTELKKRFLTEWKKRYYNERNFLCTDGLTHAECHCSSGAMAKSRAFYRMRSASDEYNAAAYKSNTALADVNSLRQKRNQRNDQFNLKIKQYNRQIVKLKEMNSRVKSLSAAPATSGNKLVYDDSK